MPRTTVQPIHASNADKSCHYEVDTRAATASLLCQNDVATSFYVIMTLLSRHVSDGV